MLRGNESTIKDIYYIFQYILLYLSPYIISLSIYIDDIRVNAVTFTTIIRAFALADDLANMMTYFELMSSQYKIQPSSYTYNTIIDFFGKKGDVDSMLRYLNMMKEKKVERTVQTYTLIIKVNKNTISHPFNGY